MQLTTIIDELNLNGLSNGKSKSELNLNLLYPIILVSTPKLIFFSIKSNNLSKKFF